MRGAKRPRRNWRADRIQAIVRRDGPRCAICDGVVNLEIRHPHPWSATIDHVVPLSLGGPRKDLKNMRLAHKLCNGTRGSGSPSFRVVL